MITILDRRDGINRKPTRCRAHEGKIPTDAPAQSVRLSINSEGPFQVPVCAICAALDGQTLQEAMITEARRHNATGAEISTFSRLMAREGE